MQQKRGQTIAAGMMMDVSFKHVKILLNDSSKDSINHSINDRIDEAYRVKYKSSPYLQPMIGERARSATVQIVPRET